MKKAMSEGALLRRLRKVAGLTQTEMAEAIGSSQGAISRIETGKDSPTIKEVIQWAEVCGYCFSWTIERTERSPSLDREELFDAQERVKALKEKLKEFPTK